MDPRHARHKQGSQRVLLTGYLAIALFVGTAGVWAATSRIAGAVIAPAQFVSDSNLKKVQHQTGGIVAELRVREGDRIAEGDLLVRLDETLPKANLAILRRQIDEFTARSARLIAERDQAAEPIFPATLVARSDNEDIAQMIAGEKRLFAARTQARAGTRSQLLQRIEQLRAEIGGLGEQRAAKGREAQMIQRELVGVRDLFKQNLVQITRLSQLEREAASLDGQQGQLTAALAQAAGKIAEIELQIIQQTEDLRAETMRELREIQGRMAELEERRGAAEDQLRRSEIRAPVAGIVHQLAVHTVGGVVSSAEPVMLLVPTGDALSLEARVSPQDIDQLRLGMAVTVRLHAFNQRTTPELRGVLSRMPADVTREAQTGLSYYLVRVHVPADEFARLAPLAVVAGMQAEAFIETGTRSPLDYLIKPVTDQFAKALRER